MKKENDFQIIKTLFAGKLCELIKKQQQQQSQGNVWKQ